MYEIEYFIDISNPVYLRIKSNYLPEIPSAVTINGKNYKVTNVKHVLTKNPDPYLNDTVEEKFIVTVTEMTEEELAALRAKRKSNIL